MSMIQQQFDRAVYVAYMTAGDGGMTKSLRALHALAAGGVDIIEVGVPFSDPVADGPTIQAAAARAINAGVALADVLALVREFRQDNTATPIILFSYYNPLLQYGLADLVAAASAAGVQGLLVVDLPLEEMHDYHELCLVHGIDPILLISPSTDSKRIEQITKFARGMIYYVCQNGTTGERDTMPEDLPRRLQAIKRCTNLPVVVGFGIANRDMAQAALQHADGFVIGSKIVAAIASTPEPKKLTALISSLDPR